MRIRILTIVLIASTSAWAQFFSLATPSDGSLVYFATSLRQKNTSQPAYGKIFRFDSEGLKLQESRTEFRSAYALRGVDVSSDGQVIATVADLDCAGNSFLCSRAERNVTTIMAGGREVDYTGNLRLSANGQWAFGAGSNPPHYGLIYGYLVNVMTGESRALSPKVDYFYVATSGRTVANDGTAVFCDEAVVLIRGSQVRRIPTEQRAEVAVIDAGANTIVYTAGELDGIRSLHVMNVATGESTSLVSDGSDAALTDDGRAVLYLSKRDGFSQAWLIKTDGSGNRKLTQDPLGIARATISGDGTKAFAVTLGGRLIKIDVASGETVELISRTPYVEEYPQRIAPGMLNTLRTVGLTNSVTAAGPPLPYVLDGIRLTIQGIPALISYVQPSAITFLTPPDVPVTLFPLTAILELSVPSQSPFASPVAAVYVDIPFPQFLFTIGQPVNRYILASHNSGTAVSADNPARPGEVIHLYAVGLGATSPQVPYGQAAPEREPLARVISPYRCRRTPDLKQEVEILFAGLAPNLAGVYQVDLRIPMDSPDGDLGVDCVDPTRFNSSSFGGGVLVRR